MLLPGHGGDPGFGVVVDLFRRFVSGSFVGIELRRASCRWRVTNLALSIASWDLISTMATFPEAPR